MNVLPELTKLVVHAAERFGLSEEEGATAAASICKNSKVAADFYLHGIDRKGLFKTPYIQLEKRYGGAFALAVTLILAEQTADKYREKGLPEAIFMDTMSDIRLWSHNYFVQKGSYGIGEVNWLVNHFRLQIFRIGRLQFQFSHIYNPCFLVAMKCKLKAPAIFIHIPQGEPLLLEKAEESLRAACQFFSEYFPAFKYRYFFTETWLIYSNNKLFMKENSNIMRFSALFTNVGNLNLEKEATKRIFGEEYQRGKGETSLQRSARTYMENGGTVGVGLGYIDKNFLQK